MKVLIVEDNSRLRKSILDYLRDEGFAVDAAADGEEGLYKAMNWEYDVVILDVMMPKLDGYAVLEKLRSDGKTLPVIFLSARGETSDRIRGLNRGADDYLAKPFEMEELVARLRSAVRRAGGAPNPILEAGPITLNRVARSVSLDGKEIELTAREYALLEILAVRRGEVVTRDFLYERLFDERDDSLSNMLDVYVYKLRQKFGREYIRTRRGMGYQLTV